MRRSCFRRKGGELCEVNDCRGVMIRTKDMEDGRKGWIDRWPKSLDRQMAEKVGSTDGRKGWIDRWPKRLDRQMAEKVGQPSLVIISKGGNCAECTLVAKPT